MERRSFLMIPLGIFFGTPSPVHATEELDRWLAECAKSPGLEAHFEEEKRLRLLKTPLLSSGKLYFSREGLLAKRTLKPRRALVLLREDELVLVDERGEKSFDLRADPRIGALVKSLSTVLRGDRPALERHYRLTFTKTDRVRLVLVPKDEKVGKIIERLELTFGDTRLESLDVLEKNGDRTTTRFAAVDFSRRYSAEEKASLFARRL